MITIYPDGYVRDLIHTEDRKLNPERHHLSKDSYSRIEMRDMCIECAINYRWNEKLEYHAAHDRFYKKDCTTHAPAPQG